jgi:pantoate--beta-alanine ligase
MVVLSEIQPLRYCLSRFRLEEKTIGFVPTMGALHTGHLSLVEMSKSQNDITVCSIFVNPTQFNNPSDLKNYPRTLSSDIQMLEDIKCDVIFTPDTKVMYDGNDSLSIDFGYLENIMEGKFRPGHFKGVGLIVAKFFNLIRPNNAYFGTKDLQQLAIIKKLAKDLLFGIEIIPVKTVREPDGLAMSSRNRLLTKSERSRATDIFRALSLAREKLIGGETVISVKNYMSDYFRKESPIQLEYFEIVDTENMQNIDSINDPEKVSLCIAGYLGKVRLIDNISLN